MPKTMAEFALSCNDPDTEAVIMDLFGRGSALVSDIPFVDRKQLVMNGSRFTGTLPTVNWGDVNDENIPEVKSTPTPFSEQAHLLRNFVKTDEVLLEDETQFHDPHAFDIEAYLESVAYDFNDKLINNHHNTGGNKKSIVGFRERIDKGTKYGVNSANKVNAAGLVLTDAATASDLRKFSEILSRFLWQLGSPSGKGVILYMADELKWRIEGLAAMYSGQGGFSQAEDQFGRTLTYYKGAQLATLGLKSDQATPIITVTETAAGLDGSSNFTSIYGSNYGANGITGWQYRPIRVRHLPDDVGIYKKTLIDWVGGIAARSTRSLGRIYNLKYS